MTNPGQQPGGEVLNHSAGFKVRLTNHFVRQRRRRVRRVLAIDYVKLQKAARRYKNRDCQAVINQYQVIFTWNSRDEELVLITLLLPGHFLTKPVVRVLL